MANLYSNENFPIPAVEQLRALGHDVVTIQEQGRASEAISDSEVLQFAVSENRAILTHNRSDFIRLHQQHPAHAGIIVCTVDPDFVGLASRIHHVILEAETNPPGLRGQLIKINRPNSASGIAKA